MIHVTRPSYIAAIALSTTLLCGACSRQDDSSETAAPPPPSTANTATDSGCAPSGELQYVCRLRNAEDIVQLGDTQWLIVSSMSAQGADPSAGRVYLVDHTTKTHEEWFPAQAPSMQHDKDVFNACPGPVNINSFSPHGLALREQSASKYRLYMTSHGEREAIEVFDVNTAGEKPAIAWVGCVVLPEKTFANSVAILEDGGFVTTKMMDPTVENPFAKVMSGEVTGQVFEWHPGGTVTAVTGTELAGANGIELSPDQRWMFVAAFGSREIVRYDRNSKPIAKQSVVIDIRPDNLRWTREGKLYTVGGNVIPPDQANECASPPCSTGWSVYEIDPQTLAAQRIAGADQTATLQGASTALAVDDSIWVGTYSGDRVGYLPKP